MNELENFEGFKPLIGLKIDFIAYLDGNLYINDYKIEPEGDCCSESWIEHIELPTVGETIINIVNVDLPEPAYEESEFDCLQFYFYKIITDKGSYDIEMRNESNGYYGGWLTCTKIKVD